MLEVNIYGIFIPILLVLTAISLVATWLIKLVLLRIGFYRLVWHPSLVDVAIFVIVLGGMTILYSSTLLDPIFQ